MTDLLSQYHLALQALMLMFATLMVQSLVAATAHRSQQRYIPGVLDSQLGHESFVFRSHRTFMNSLENLPLMVGPAIVGMLAGFDAAQLGIMCWIYAICRILHMALYYLIATEKNPSPRSYFYMVGLLVNVTMLVVVFMHVMEV
ncbi:MAPEG family protein [Oceanobacter mangrovi]|uniref:MAPEG family protein n=1 Tax=Oceanobacter mangrovi TaxID=2862510 RepID=UPI001C8DD184|nr:MAPEG family protein [Oceanobacter mangrovi]